MSEAQAIQSDESVIEDTETAEVVEEVEEVEIVVAGEDEPTSKPRPSGFQKRLGKMKAKIDASNTEAEEAKRRADALEEENKLLRMAQQQKTSNNRPDEDDFDNRADYLAADQKWTDARAEAIAVEKFNQLNQQNQSQQTQTQSRAALNRQIDAHYDRSAELKVPDYSETEAVAADILGDDIAEQIVANTDNSHLVMYHLGKNPGKAEHLKELLATEPMKGVLEIGRLAGSLSVRSKSNTPDPEQPVDPGSGISKSERGPKGATYE